MRNKDTFRRVIRWVPGATFSSSNGVRLSMLSMAVFTVLILSRPSFSQDAGLDSATESGREPSGRESVAREPDARELVAESREMLRLFQIGASQLELFSDGRSLTDDGFATLIRLLYRAPSFPLHKVHRWQQWAGDFERLRTEPNRFRGAFLHLVGRATSIEKVPVPNGLRQRFALDHFFRVTLETANGTAIVYCRSIPDAWADFIEDSETVKEQSEPLGSVAAMFLKLGETPGNGSAAVLPIVAVANAFAWHPNAPDAGNGVSPDHVLLAKHGMDINQFSFVEDRKALTTLDRECFYQLLDVSSRIGIDDSLAVPQETVDVTELLQRPESHRGRHYTLVGTVRRAVKIQVDDIDIVDRFGIDHYYELEIFTDPAVTVRFVDDSGDDKVFSRYPIVVCSANVPGWLPQGADVRADVVVSGFFLKHWAYKTQYMSAGAPAGTADRLQISPLLVGTRIGQYAPSRKDNATFGLVGGVSFATLLVAIGVYVWKSEKGDRDFRRWRRSRSTFDLKQFDQDDS